MCEFKQWERLEQFAWLFYTRLSWNCRTSLVYYKGKHAKTHEDWNPRIDLSFKTCSAIRMICPWESREDTIITEPFRNAWLRGVLESLKISRGCTPQAKNTVRMPLNWTLNSMWLMGTWDGRNQLVALNHQRKVSVVSAMGVTVNAVIKIVWPTEIFAFG